MIECKEQDPHGEIWTPLFKELAPGELFKRRSTPEIFMKTAQNAYILVKTGAIFTGFIDLDERVTAYSGKLIYWPKRI